MAQTDLYWDDEFNRDDSTDPGENWSTTGSLQIINGSLRQSGASSVANANALQESANISTAMGKEMEIGALVACGDDTAQRNFNLVMRADAMALADCYMVTLRFENDVATLLIRKRTGGSNTTAASATVTNDMNLVGSSYDNVFQRLSARITDQDGGVKVEAFLNGEERPILEATDISYPLHKAGNYFGMRFGDADAGVDGHLYVDNFFAQAIVAQETDFEYQDRAYWTLGSLIDAARAIALRDSSDGTKSKVWRQYAVMAEQDYFDALGRPDWAEDLLDITLTADKQEIELPPWVDHYDPEVRIGTSDFTLRIVDERQFRENHTFKASESGTPWTIRAGGRGPSGGLLLRPFPVPSTDTSATLRVFSRPRFMVESDDIPIVPQGDAHHLIAGMVHYYNLSDNSRTKLVAWSQKWNEHIRRARKAQGRRRGVGRRKILRPGLTGDGFNTGYSGRTRGAEGLY